MGTYTPLCVPHAMITLQDESGLSRPVCLACATGRLLIFPTEGVLMGKVVTTDASLRGWGAVFEGQTVN